MLKGGRIDGRCSNSGGGIEKIRTAEIESSEIGKGGGVVQLALEMLVNS